MTPAVIPIVSLFAGACAGTALHSYLLLRSEHFLRRRIHDSLSAPRHSFFRKWERWRWLFPQRKKQFLKDLPDLLDILGVGLSAGLTFEKALEATVPLLPRGALKDECARFMNDLAVGRGREEALASLGERVGDDRFHIVITILVHSLKRGVPLGPVLFHQADAMRTARFFEMEKSAHTASIRLLFPLILFIFPSLFLVLLGPLILQYIFKGQLF